MAARGDAAAQLPSDIGGFGARKTGSRAIDYQPEGDRSFPLRLQPGLCNPLKGPGLSAQKKSAIVKADRNPAVVPELDDLRYLTLQGLLGFPSEGFGYQPDPIANLETGVWLRFSVHLLFAFSPSSTRRRMASGRDG